MGIENVATFMNMMSHMLHISLEIRAALGVASRVRPIRSELGSWTSGGLTTLLGFSVG